MALLDQLFGASSGSVGNKVDSDMQGKYMDEMISLNNRLRTATTAQRAEILARFRVIKGVWIGMWGSSNLPAFPNGI